MSSKPASKNLPTRFFNLYCSDSTLVEASLDALVGLYQASNEMDSALFTPFTQTILQQYPFIDSAQYLSYVSQLEKQEFIDEMREQGFSQFDIHNPDSLPDSAKNQQFLPGHQFYRAANTLYSDGNGIKLEYQSNSTRSLSWFGKN